MDAKKYPLLDKYTYSLNDKIAVDPVKYMTIGRETEIEKLENSLLRQSKNNPLLVAEPGVGKTNIVEGFVSDLLKGDNSGIADELLNYDVRTFELAQLDGASFTGAQFRELIEEVKALNSEVILFIDEIHNIANQTKSGIDPGNILKPAISRGEIKLIGATTFDEYHDYLEGDRALARRFDLIEVDEPTPIEAKKILRSTKKIYEYMQGVEILPEASDDAVDLSVRYVADRYLPDKSLDLLDESSAYAHLHGMKVVDTALIAKILQRSTGIPVSSILKQDTQRVNELKKVLMRRVKGQGKALSDIMRVIRIAYAGLQDPKRPLGSFLFLGPTGTGKTETGLALAEGLFDSEDSVIKIDCSEFQAPNSGRELTGYGNKPGILTEQIKHKPYCVLIVDEIEKADKSVHDLFLQVLDKGVLSDNRGRHVNFKNTIIIMTTNLAAEVVINKLNYSSLEDNDAKDKLFENEINDTLKETFRPEFLNRIDHKIVFDVLDKEIVEQIVHKELDIFEAQLATSDLYLSYDQDLIDYLVTVGFNPENGARPIRRAISDKVIGPVSLLKLDLQDNNPKHIDTFELRVLGKHKAKYDNKGTRHIEFGGFNSETSNGTEMNAV